VAGSTRIYTEDGDVVRYASLAGIGVSRMADLPLPPDANQGKLDLTPLD
jgi:hypothetical protein